MIIIIIPGNGPWAMAEVVHVGTPLREAGNKASLVH
jgi:hypothetical protein